MASICGVSWLLLLEAGEASLGVPNCNCCGINWWLVVGVVHVAGMGTGPGNGKGIVG